MAISILGSCRANSISDVSIIITYQSVIKFIRVGPSGEDDLPVFAI